MHKKFLRISVLALGSALCILPATREDAAAMWVKNDSNEEVVFNLTVTLKQRQDSEHEEVRDMGKYKHHFPFYEAEKKSFVEANDDFVLVNVKTAGERNLVFVPAPCIASMSVRKTLRMGDEFEHAINSG